MNGYDNIQTGNWDGTDCFYEKSMNRSFPDWGLTAFNKNSFRIQGNDIRKRLLHHDEENGTEHVIPDKWVSCNSEQEYLVLLSEREIILQKITRPPGFSGCELIYS